MEDKRITTIIRNEALKLDAPIDPFGIIELYTLLRPLLGMDPYTARETMEMEYLSVLEYLTSNFKRLGVEEPEKLASQLIERILIRCKKVSKM